MFVLRRTGFELYAVQIWKHIFEKCKAKLSHLFLIELVIGGFRRLDIIRVTHIAFNLW